MQVQAVHEEMHNIWISLCPTMCFALIEVPNKSQQYYAIMFNEDKSDLVVNTVSLDAHRNELIQKRIADRKDVDYSIIEGLDFAIPPGWIIRDNIQGYDFVINHPDIMSIMVGKQSLPKEIFVQAKKLERKFNFDDYKPVLTEKDMDTVGFYSIEVNLKDIIKEKYYTYFNFVANYYGFSLLLKCSNIGLEYEITGVKLHVNYPEEPTPTSDFFERKRLELMHGTVFKDKDKIVFMSEGFTTDSYLDIITIQTSAMEWKCIPSNSVIIIDEP